MPIVFLDRFLGLRPDTACRTEGTVVVVRVDEHECGVVVDGRRVDGTCGSRDLRDAAGLTAIVVKPIGPLLAQLGLYSGATVLGDGSVVLILDIRGMLRAARLPPIPPADEGEIAAAAAAVAGRYLVCTSRGGRRVALPLGEVARIERHPRTDLERLGPRTVVRRGDGFAPVVDADAVLGAVAGPDADPARLVVLGGGDGAVAVEVGGIVDVLPAETDRDALAGTPGAVCTLGIGGRAAELVDRAAVLRLVNT